MRFGTGALFAAASATTYGSLGVFAKLAYAEGWNVPSLLSARFALALLTLLPFALWARDARGWRGAGAAYLIGAVGYASTTALYFPSIRLLPAAVASFLLYLSPALVMLLAALFLSERITLRGALALGLSLVGLLLLSAGAFRGTLSLPGILLAAGSAVAFAATTVLSRNVAQRMHWARLSLMVCLGALTVYVAFSTATGQLRVPPGGKAALWALGIGVLATGIPMSFFFAALARTGATQVSVISTLEPVSTLVLAAVFLVELPDVVGVVGGALIVGGAALLAMEPVVPPAPHE